MTERWVSESVHIPNPRTDGRQTAGDYRALVEEMDKADIPDGAFVTDRGPQGVTFTWTVSPSGD